MYIKVIRTSLLFCWLYTFHSRKTAKQQIPRSLMSSPISQPIPSTLETAVVEEVSNPQNHLATVVQVSFRDRFPHLPYTGPLIVRDPVESCYDLEEVRLCSLQFLIII
jgi:hypothetical protein